MDPESVLAAYVDAVAAGDRRRAFAAVEGALSEGMGLRTLYLDVFQPALREVRLFDRYAGPPLEPGERSLAFRLRYAVTSAGDDEVVDASTATIAQGVRARLGGRLRA